MSKKPDFWLSCGHHLLDRDVAGRMVVTDEFLKAYLARPELVPPPEACLAERRLHGALLNNPRAVVPTWQISEIVDADARENWETMVAWRDHLARHQTLEAAYLEIVRRNIKFPPMLIGQLVQAILRNALNDCTDVFILRAAEMFFRPQKLILQDDSIIAIDQEIDASLGRRPQSPLVTLLGLPATIEVDMLNDSTAGSYWQRSDRFDMAIDLMAGRRGSAALGDVIVHWISHLLAVDVAIEPLTAVHDISLCWYVGLDSEATRIGDAVWNGSDIDNNSWSRLIGLYQLTFRDPLDMIERVRGEPVYLLAATAVDETLRLKPQNLVGGLPLVSRECVN
jgi:Family of unknown function (DUF6352)